MKVPTTETTNFDNTGEILDAPESELDTAPQYYEPSETDKELTSFIIDHTDRWRDYRDQNFMDDWLKYERIFRGQWVSDDKTRQSERSRIISPATQQAVETRHAEIMEAIFGQGQFFDIKDDLNDQNGKIDVEKLKAQLNEDFSQDKIRKSIDQIELLAEIYGTGIGEVTVSKEKYYYPAEMPMPQQQMPGMPQNMQGFQPQPQQVAYGVSEQDRVCVKLSPVNPKNFLFDPNGVSIDDCMGVGIEKYVSIHKIAQGIASGKYLKVDIGSMYEDESLEPTQESRTYEDDKVKLLTYYGLVPREYLQDEEVEELFEQPEINDQIEDYQDMVEAIIVIANGSVLLKKEENPYMMKDRPVVLYQDDTVPNRLLGRGTVEKAYNMQCAIDGSMRSHMDALALTVAPMVGIDATRLPRGARFEVKPGKAFLTNGSPSEIIFPFNFGTNDGAALTTSKEFERMLLMATGTIDSNGQVSQVSRDGQLDMATATIIKKYKRTLVNFQEDFLIPFIKKAAWRYMQFDPERYPSADVKFLPTGGLGIIAREYEQKQLAFLMQTLGAQSPLTPILMQAIIENSALPNREALLEQLKQMSAPNPQQQQQQLEATQMEAAKVKAEIDLKMAQAQKAKVEADLAPEEMKVKMISALSNNLNEDNEGKDFERRAKIAELMLAEKDIESNEKIAKMQMEAKRAEKSQNDDYLKTAQSMMN